MKKQFTAVVLIAFCAIGAAAQAKIPEEFWKIPIKGINPVLAELYAATQGQTLLPFTVDPTPDLLFNKMELQSISQMDGTTIKTIRGKTSLKGNTVSIELITYNGKELLMTCTTSILCNLQNKTNMLTRLLIVPTSGNTVDLSVSSYDMQNDPQAASDLAQYFSVWGKFFRIWYSAETIDKYLRQNPAN